MIRRCTADDFDRILAIINDAARAYRGIIPDDRWKDPYMPVGELASEIAAGIAFDGYEIAGNGLVGVMGIQAVEDVTLIRHAYVATDRQRSGIGSALLEGLLGRADRPVLIGTWAAADWAIAFYLRHGFETVPGPEKSSLLRRYWTVPERQIETSVVLADARWRARGDRREPGL
ncbi:MAG: GNAT family N-acetyltransferase [Immundisolibacterales bacterium]|nr:GNAT family N-acetyltransferase [Immundisolibacterales bacterium]